MAIEIKGASIRMFHPDLQSTPTFDVPMPLRLKWYAPGDTEKWIDLQRQVECRIPITDALYEHDFGSDEDVLAMRQCFLLDRENRAIGTATAWSETVRGEVVGRVHWVAIHPEFQHRGLSKPLLAAVCQRMIDLGHDRAFLLTSSERLPAINLYLGFGFVPLLRKVRDENVWREVEDRLETRIMDRAVVHSPMLKVMHLFS
jgi:GNAT superfamily N-acetyltransferase